MASDNITASYLTLFFIPPTFDSPHRNKEQGENVLQLFLQQGAFSSHSQHYTVAALLIKWHRAEQKSHLCLHCMTI